MRRRIALRLTLATFAFVTSLLLLYVAAAVEPLWAFVAAGLGTWVTGGAFAVLVFSAARQYMGPRPSLITMPYRPLSQEAVDRFRAELDRDGGDGR